MNEKRSIAKRESMKSALLWLPSANEKAHFLFHFGYDAACHYCSATILCNQPQLLSRLQLWRVHERKYQYQVDTFNLIKTYKILLKKNEKKDTETMKSFAYFLLILQMNSSGSLPPVIKIGKLTS